MAAADGRPPSIHGGSSAAAAAAGSTALERIVIRPPHADLPEVPVEGVTFEAVRVGSNPPTWKWHCPTSGSTWLHLRSAQDCQFGQVHLIASARQYSDGRVRYRKPYGFAALKSQSKERIAAQAATIKAGGGGDNTVLEKCLMYRLRGRPHVIQLLEVWHDPKNVHTVMEYLQEDLICLLNRVGVLNESTVQRVFAHMCVGLKQLHDIGYCHRDLSPENVLVTSDAKSEPLAKVIDFGMACPLARGADGSSVDLPAMRIPFGKMSYLSPEYYGKAPYDGQKNDLWALGCTLFTVSERKMLFEHPSVADAKFSYLASNRHAELFAWSRATNHAWDTLPEAQRREPMSLQLQDLLTGLLQVDPAKRVATIDQVLAHPWVKPYVDIAAAEFAAATAGAGAVPGAGGPAPESGAAGAPAAMPAAAAASSSSSSSATR